MAYLDGAQAVWGRSQWGGDQKESEDQQAEAGGHVEHPSGLVQHPGHYTLSTLCSQTSWLG